MPTLLFKYIIIGNTGEKHCLCALVVCFIFVPHVGVVLNMSKLCGKAGGCLWLPAWSVAVAEILRFISSQTYLLETRMISHGYLSQRRLLTRPLWVFFPGQPPALVEELSFCDGYCAVMAVKLCTCGASFVPRQTESIASFPRSRRDAVRRPNSGVPKVFSGSYVQYDPFVAIMHRNFGSQTIPRSRAFFCSLVCASMRSISGDRKRKRTSPTRLTYPKSMIFRPWIRSCQHEHMLIPWDAHHGQSPWMVRSLFLTFTMPLTIALRGLALRMARELGCGEMWRQIQTPRRFLTEIRHDGPVHHFPLDVFVAT